MNLRNVTNLEKAMNGDLLADSHITLNRWKKYISPLLVVCRVSVVKQSDIHITEE
jgi:hypothetical protein